MKLYLAYGSNLNKQQMRLRCPDAVPVTTAAVQDYQLVFRRGVLNAMRSTSMFTRAFQPSTTRKRGPSWHQSMGKPMKAFPAWCTS